jgi:hypothetical protein
MRCIDSVDYYDPVFKLAVKWLPNQMQYLIALSELSSFIGMSVEYFETTYLPVQVAHPQTSLIRSYFEFSLVSGFTFTAYFKEYNKSVLVLHLINIR